MRMVTHTESRKNKGISRAEYERLLDRLEDLEDTLVALRAEARGKPPEDALPTEMVQRLIARKDHPLLIWREFRGLTQKQLAEKAGLADNSYIANIERRKKPGSVATLKKLAAVLNCDLDDLTE